MKFKVGDRVRVRTNASESSCICGEVARGIGFSSFMKSSRGKEYKIDDYTGYGQETYRLENGNYCECWVDNIESTTNKTNMKFKVGDKVKVISSHRSMEAKQYRGAILTITSKGGRNSQNDVAHYSTDSGYNGGIYEDELELIEKSLTSEVIENFFLLY